MYCQNCGTKIGEEDSYCTGCGANVRPIPAFAPPKDIGDDPAMRLLLPVGRSGLAIAAGYAGLFSLIILPAPIALLLGSLAIIDIRKHPKKHGMGRAVFGVIMGIIGTLVLGLGILSMAKGH